MTPATTFVTTSSSTHSPVTRYDGTGDLLTGYCATPEYTLISGGPTVYYAPFVGCIGDKLDCCPFTPSTSSTSVNLGTIMAPTTITQTVQTPQSPSSSGTVSDSNGSDAYPQADDVEQEVQSHCADDYYTTAGGCCPRYIPAPLI